MCNSVIKLQVSYQFPRRRSQWPLQEQQQSSLQQQVPHQHQSVPAQSNPADAAAQQQPAVQAASDHPTGSATFGQDDSLTAARERSTAAEEEGQQLATGHWRDHAYSMAAASSHQQRLGPHWQRWPRLSGGAVHLQSQDAYPLPSLDASTGHDGHRQAQLPSTVTLPGSFAASGLDLHHHPAASEQAQLSELIWQSPAGPAQAGAGPDGDNSTAPDSPSHAMFSHLKSASCSHASGQESTSDRDENQQFGAQQTAQDTEDQWMILNHDVGREQQSRWAPARIVRHMMTRAQRHPAERRSRRGSVSAQTNLADAAAAST